MTMSKPESPSEEDLNNQNIPPVETDEPKHDQTVLAAGISAIGATARLIELADPPERKVLVDQLVDQLKDSGISVTDTNRPLSRQEQRELLIARREAVLRGRKPKSGPTIRYGSRE